MAKLKVGLIGGGGPGNFFGHVHKRAIALDASRELVAGALRSNPQAAMESAQEYDVQGYPDYQSMLDACTNGDLQLDYVTIVTPNHAHYAPTKAFLEAGIPVLCEKPITMTVDEALDLERIINEKDVPFILATTRISLKP
jgi:predicted dehydrogenase